MSKIVRYQFMGNWIIFGLLFLSGFGLPFAILYLFARLVRTETEMENPEEFLADYRAGKLKTS